MDNFKELLQHKWIVIWWITAIVKWTIAVRNSNFKVIVFITDLILAIIIGYVSWELVVDKDFSNILKVIFTFFMSWNAFVLVSIMFNQELAKSIFMNFIGRNLDLNEKGKWNDK